MPIYEYLCAKCNTCFALLKMSANDDTGTKCPGCGSEEVKKLMSAFAVCAPGGGATSLGQGSGFGGG